MAEAPNKPSEGYSSSELLSSAKLVAESAQSALRNEYNVDKAKAADAAGDLLDAASQYGKLDDQKGIGQYVDKAADYLHQYQGGATAPSTTAPSESEAPKPESKSEEGGAGFGQFTKLAGNFLNK